MLWVVQYAKEDEWICAKRTFCLMQKCLFQGLDVLALWKIMISATKTSFVEHFLPQHTMEIALGQKFTPVSICVTIFTVLLEDWSVSSPCVYWFFFLFDESFQFLPRQVRPPLREEKHNADIKICFRSKFNIFFKKCFFICSVSKHTWHLLSWIFADSASVVMEQGITKMKLQHFVSNQ